MMRRTLFEAIVGDGFDDVQDGDDLRSAWSKDDPTFSLTPSSAKYFKSLSSRSVRRANIAWSNGAIFLTATFVPEGRWTAEMTTPYAPSPITSRTWYALPRRQLGVVKIVLTDIEFDFSGLSGRRALCDSLLSSSSLRVGHCS